MPSILMGAAPSGNKAIGRRWILRRFRRELVGEQIAAAPMESYNDAMRAFLITSGVVFGLITLAHVARIVVEGRSVATDPIFILLTLLTTGLSAWAWRLLWKLDRRP